MLTRKSIPLLGGEEGGEGEGGDWASGDQLVILSAELDIKMFSSRMVGQHRRVTTDR